MGSMFLSSVLAKFFKIKNVSVDSFVFKLHYKFTSVALLGASLLVTGYQFFGNPIYCIMKHPATDKTYKKFVETFCWIESTFSLPKAYDKEVGVEVVYPGVDNYKKGDEVVEHAYYQWVCLLLFMQCLMFLLPHVIWKSWEGGRIKQLLMNLDKPVVEQKDKKSKFVTLSEYFFMQGTGHKIYYLRYFLCEFLNLVNVVGQLFLINSFLHGEFTRYGTEVIKFVNQEQEDRTDPMMRVFPRISKCSFYNYGPSGDLQHNDVFCVLPLNILNEKIYVFIWFWFIILAVFTLLSVTCLLLLAVWPEGRSIAMKYACVVVDDRNMETVLEKGSVGDWFILYLLAKCMDKMNFKEFVDILAEQDDTDDDTPL